MHTTYRWPAGCALSPVVPMTPEALIPFMGTNTPVAPVLPTQREVDKVPSSYLEEAEAFVLTLMHVGIDPTDLRLMPAPGVNTIHALTHIDCCIKGRLANHEDRILGCSVLVTRFFENIKYYPRGSTKSSSFEGFIYAAGG